MRTRPGSGVFDVADVDKASSARRCSVLTGRERQAYCSMTKTEERATDKKNQKPLHHRVGRCSAEGKKRRRDAAGVVYYGRCCSKI